MCGCWLALVTIEAPLGESNLHIEVIYHVYMSRKITSYIIFYFKLTVEAFAFH